MHSESRMDESDYLFLHLMDGNDAQVHDPVTCFQIKVEVACDQRDDDENSFGGSIEKPIPPDSYKAHSTYFSWNEKIRLKLGPTTEKSTLVVTLLKNDVDSITGNDTCDALGTPVRQLVYAKTRIFLRKLLSGQSAQRDHESDSSDQESSQHGFKRHDRMLYLKILSKKITPGLCNISKGTSNTDRVNTRPLSPDSKIRAAENAYSVALNELSATLVGPITAEKPSTRANSREHVSAELGSCNSGFDQGG